MSVVSKLFGGRKPPKQKGDSLTATVLASDEDAYARSSFSIGTKHGPVLMILTEKPKAEGFSRLCAFPGNGMTLEISTSVDEEDPEPDDGERGDWAREVCFRCLDMLDAKPGTSFAIDVEDESEETWFVKETAMEHVESLGFPDGFVRRTMARFEADMLGAKKGSCRMKPSL